MNSWNLPVLSASQNLNINDMPVEILMKILADTCSDDSLALDSIKSVCTRWSQIANDIGYFFYYMESKKMKKRIQEASSKAILFPSLHSIIVGSKLNLKMFHVCLQLFLQMMCLNFKEYGLISANPDLEDHGCEWENNQRCLKS